MSDKTTGWLFVAAQVVLLAAIVLVPGADHWPRPAWMLTVAGICLVSGIVIAAVGAFGLGSALTATPVPNSDGELQTDGLYALVRHPVYTGVLLAIFGIGLRSGNVITALLVVASIVFFSVKARWEEQRLAERYDDYGAFAARTPRFVPRPGSLRRLRSVTPRVGKHVTKKG